MAEINAIPWNGYRVVSTFSGCGGSCLGYRMAGFKVLWANEFVEEAQDTYRANAAPSSFLDCRDIRTVQPQEILDKLGINEGELDLFDGSPPCAAFSTAGLGSEKWGVAKSYSTGKTQVVDNLFFEYTRILRGLKPKVFVAENVSGLVKGEAKGYFKNIFAELKACGYKVESSLIDASWLGVPQRRQRIIFVGVRDDLPFSPVFPKPFQSQVTVREAVPWIDEPLDKIDPAIVGTDGANVPLSGKVLTEWHNIKIGAMSKKYFLWSKISPDRAAPTITTVPCIVHPFFPRLLLIRELKRIASFPDDFVLTGGYRRQYERIGRSVPPFMMREIASTIRDQILAKLP